MANVARKQEARGNAEALPPLSHSRVNRYLHCPEQYRLYYIERLRPRILDASLVFGQLLHQALASFFRAGEGPINVFVRAWEELRNIDLAYGQRESWAKLQASGQALLGKFVEEEVPRLGAVQASEKPFTLNVTTLGAPFVGVIDLVTAMDGKLTVVDFKTATSSYQIHDVVLSDQLTAYQLAEPAADQVALCVFLKTVEPRIEWYRAAREPAQVVEYLRKTEYVASQIAAAHFYKRPGRWCGYCDYLPVCMGDRQKAEESLIQVAPRP